MESDTAIDLERFAALSAEIDAGAPREELCAREGISVAEWTAAQETWLARLADDSSRKRFELTNRYNAAFVARRRALAHGPRALTGRRAPAPKPAPLELAAPLPVAPPPVIAFTSASLEGPAPVAPPPVVAPPIMARADARYDVSEYVDAELDEPVTYPPPPLAVAPPAVAPRAPAPTPEPEGTAMVSLAELMASKALPFLEEDSAPRDDFSATVAPRSNATPFDALPFQKAAATASPSPQAAQPNAGLPFSQASSPATSQSGQFRAVSPVSAPTPVPAPVAPPPAPVVTLRLTVEQFASLAAEIAVNPPAAAQIRARYGFDEAAHRVEAEEYARRFAEDSALYARYYDLFKQYREWLAQNAR